MPPTVSTQYVHGFLDASEHMPALVLSMLLLLWGRVGGRASRAPPYCFREDVSTSAVELSDTVLCYLYCGRVYTLL